MRRLEGPIRRVLGRSIGFGRAVFQRPFFLSFGASGCLASAATQSQSGAVDRFKRAGCHWSKAGANALLAVKCCLENKRWADFLDWRACRAAAA